jgi:hypothetical protein
MLLQNTGIRQIDGRMKKKERSRVSVTKKSYHLLLQLIPLLGHRPALFSQLYDHLFSLQTEAYYCFTSEGVLKHKESEMIKTI